jgi:hypothetical protein
MDLSILPFLPDFFFGDVGVEELISFLLLTFLRNVFASD